MTLRTALSRWRSARAAYRRARGGERIKAWRKLRDAMTAVMRAVERIS